MHILDISAYGLAFQRLAQAGLAVKTLTNYLSGTLSMCEVILRSSASRKRSLESVSAPQEAFGRAAGSSLHTRDYLGLGFKLPFRQSQRGLHHPPTPK